MLTSLKCWTSSSKKIEFETVKSILKQDLNCLPDSETESDDDQIEHSESDAKTEILKKKRRTQSAGLSLEDLSKYFAVPIVEASRKLNVGVTVLKRKCREFGIPRWPYRMVKSIDSLIHDLQEEEAEKQQENNKAAAIVAAEKQKKLETEMRNIVERPFMEIQIDIKRFRQDSYNKRRRASRAKKNQESLATSSST